MNIESIRMFYTYLITFRRLSFKKVKGEKSFFSTYQTCFLFLSYILQTFYVTYNLFYFKSVTDKTLIKNTNSRSVFVSNKIPTARRAKMPKTTTEQNCYRQP